MSTKPPQFIDELRSSPPTARPLDENGMRIYTADEIEQWLTTGAYPADHPIAVARAKELADEKAAAEAVYAIQLTDLQLHEIQHALSFWEDAADRPEFAEEIRAMLEQVVRDTDTAREREANETPAETKAIDRVETGLLYNDPMELVRQIYASPNGSTGCCWHVVLDDYNLEDNHVEWCAEHVDHGHPACVALAPLLVDMTEDQRSDLLKGRYTR